MVKRLAQVRDFADRLVRAGAVMILPKGRERRQRVEKLAWRGPHAVSWMNGAKQHGAHRLTFDDLRGVTKHGVYFLRGSHIVGYLLREASAEPKHRSGLFGMNGHLAPAVHTPHSRRE